ncbi:glycosyltransferase [Microcella sp.]|uniref:glycosyltransferase n=1 Tax=Microcella sp. TaxID=1913979 RepID=UPI003F71C312
MPRATDGPRRERVLVLLDATGARGHDAALAAYVDALVRGLDGELVVACRPDDAEHYRLLAPAAAIEVGPAALRWRGIRMLWRQLALPRIARRHDVDAVHSPRPPVPLLIARPRVVTVHSMRCFDRSTPGERGDALRRAAARTAVRTADEVVALHSSIAAALESTLGFAARDVLVSPPADDLERFAAAHRVAYRAAAAVVPAESGPITLPVLDEPATDPQPGGTAPAH